MREHFSGEQHVSVIVEPGGDHVVAQWGCTRSMLLADHLGG